MFCKKITVTENKILTLLCNIFIVRYLFIYAIVFGGISSLHFSYKKGNKGNFKEKFSKVFLSDPITKKEKITTSKPKKEINKIDITTTARYRKNQPILQALMLALQDGNKYAQIKFNNTHVQELVFELLQDDDFLYHNFSKKLQEILKKYLIFEGGFLKREDIPEYMKQQHILYRQNKDNNSLIGQHFTNPEQIYKIGNMLLYNYLENLSFANIISDILGIAVDNSIMIDNEPFLTHTASLYSDIYRGYDILLLSNKDQSMIPIDITAQETKSSTDEGIMILSFRKWIRQVYDYNHHYINYLLGIGKKPNFNLNYPEQARELGNYILNLVKAYKYYHQYQTIDNKTSNDQ